MTLFEFMNSSIVCAITGGLLGGGFTTLGVLTSMHNAKKKQLEAEKADIKAFCQAVHSELETLLVLYIDSIGRKLSELKPGEVFFYNYFSSQEYFTVFNSNANLIGKISNVSLRTKIVQVYLRSKGMMDSLRLNSTYAKEYEDASFKAAHSKLPFDLEQKERLFRVLERNTPVLVALNADVIRMMEETILDLSLYVQNLN